MIQHSVGENAGKIWRLLDEKGELSFAQIKKELKAKNEDVYAWINIPNTNINYPVVQSNVDDIISDACDEFGFITGEDEEPDDYDIEDEDDGDSSFYNLEAEISPPPQVLSEADERKAARAAFRAKLGTN